MILVDQPWSCRGAVNIDLVRVTLRTTVADAIQLDQDCSGRVGRVEVETWTADGIKVQNRGVVAHDLVIESGYIKCHAVAGNAHQDGIQAMGGSRITFRELRVDCLRNANLYLSRGGSGATTPTDIVCERLRPGPERRPDALLQHVASFGRTEQHHLHRTVHRDPRRLWSRRRP